MIIFDKHYDSLPPNEHATGDIWHGLQCPSLTATSIAGIAITPACDLRQQKTDTATILPVAPIHVWLSSSMTGKRIVAESLKSAINPTKLERTTEEILNPIELNKLRLELKQDLLNQKYQTALRAIEKYEKFCQSPTSESLQSLCLELGKSLRSVIDKLIRNTLRDELFFLPKFSLTTPSKPVLTDHSVVLFRYPFTVPLNVLDASITSVDETTPGAWTREVQKLGLSPSDCIRFESERPIKHGRLTGTYTKELLAKFASFYIRLGIPDLSDTSHADLIKSIAG